MATDYSDDLPQPNQRARRISTVSTASIEADLRATVQAQRSPGTAAHTPVPAFNTRPNPLQRARQGQAAAASSVPPRARSATGRRQTISGRSGFVQRTRSAAAEARQAEALLRPRSAAAGGGGPARQRRRRRLGAGHQRRHSASSTAVGRSPSGRHVARFAGQLTTGGDFVIDLETARSGGLRLAVSPGWRSSSQAQRPPRARPGSARSNASSLASRRTEETEAVRVTDLDAFALTPYGGVELSERTPGPAMPLPNITAAGPMVNTMIHSNVCGTPFRGGGGRGLLKPPHRDHGVIESVVAAKVLAASLDAGGMLVPEWVDE